MKTEQEQVWSGEFGRAYTDRNLFSDTENFNAHYVKRYGQSRDEINLTFLEGMDRNARILEVGANVGDQLEALRRIGFRHLAGIELQRDAVERAKARNPQVDVMEGSAFDMPFKDGFFDLVFTNNVLIHFSPKDIGKVQDEMMRVSRRFILGFEYYAPEYVEVSYRGHQNLLWKTDFCQLFLDRFSTLRRVRERLFNCLDDPGMVDKQYLLEKS